MAIIKLTEAGESHTMTVTACEQVKGQYGEQVKFSGGGDTLFIGLEPATRQLNRCGFDIADGGTEQVEGETLRFSREPNTSKKGAKPYWAIELAAKGDAAPKASKRLTGPSDAKPDRLSEAMAEHGIHEGDVEAVAGRAAAFEDSTPYAEGEEPTPEQKRSEAANKLAKKYMALWDVVAKHQTAEGAKHGFPIDGASVNNAAATIWICLDRRNLL